MGDSSTKEVSDGPDDGLSVPEREAIAEATGAGGRGAARIRVLAERQGAKGNQGALERCTQAVERVLSREVVLDLDGPPEVEPLHGLDPAHVTPERPGTGPMELRPTWRVAAGRDRRRHPLHARHRAGRPRRRPSPPLRADRAVPPPRRLPRPHAY
ncbi:hypothetical protein ACFV6F_38190, partial [Kitasatospora phosalacinea]|uniref:hypothetical protein n=1 Tax=Kitasatospora phosalacinea TaxID=2065 RepID=UPI00365A7DD0